MSTAATTSPTPRTSQPKTISSETFGQVQSLARRIPSMLASEQEHGRVVGVTSCSRKEGVSVIAANLAVCASELYSGRVLLVDANPRYASVAGQFGVASHPGLGDCLAGELPVSECIVATSSPNLSVLPAGSGSNLASHLSEQRSSTVFRDLRKHFDLIVIDLPPAREMDEAILASHLADGFLLVLESERIRRQVAQRVKRQFEQIDAKLLGVVLNKRRNHIPGWLYRRL